MKNFNIDSDDLNCHSSNIEEESNNTIENSLKNQSYSLFKKVDDVGNEYNIDTFEINSRKFNTEDEDSNISKNISINSSDFLKSRNEIFRIRNNLIKQYFCNIENCKKKYKSKENLNLHIKNIHLNIKPYICRFCSANFSHRNGNNTK